MKSKEEIPLYSSQEKGNGYDRSKDILEILPEGIFVHDGEKFLYANPEAIRLLKISNNHDIVGKPIIDFIHKKNVQGLNKTRERVNQPGYKVPLREWKLVLKDGTVIDVEMVGASIIYDGKKAAIVSIRDIGDRKRAEKLMRQIEKKKKLLREARENERLRTEFLSNISHEFKTPLNAILSTLQLLKVVQKDRMENNPSLENYMGIMKKNSYRILRLTNNILDITEMDNGHYKLNIINNDIIDTINKIIKPVCEYLNNKGIDFSFKTDIEKLIIACDPNEIQRVLLNLISNSIKAVDSDGKIEVYLYKTDRNIKIIVKDNGCGIPEDKLEYVFDALRQVDRSFTRDKEGSGIGLYIVKYIIEKHGGRVKAKSRSDEGSEFQITLPITKVNRLQGDIINQRVENYLKSDPIEKVNIEFSDIY